MSQQTSDCYDIQLPEDGYYNVRSARQYVLWVPLIHRPY